MIKRPRNRRHGNGFESISARFSGLQCAPAACSSSAKAPRWTRAYWHPRAKERARPPRATLASRRGDTQQIPAAIWRLHLNQTAGRSQNTITQNAKARSSLTRVLLPFTEKQQQMQRQSSSDAVVPLGLKTFNPHHLFFGELQSVHSSWPASSHCCYFTSHLQRLCQWGCAFGLIFEKKNWNCRKWSCKVIWEEFDPFGIGRKWRVFSVNNERRAKKWSGKAKTL